MSSVVIYHNPRCSKSRATLQLLEDRGIHPEIVLYLETPPDADALRGLIATLGFDSARQLIRRGDDLYQQLDLDNPALDEAALIAALAAHPSLIERPIVVNGLRARLGRPPQQVLEIL
ncbi:arsenate reductase (glutaredoxin) [Edwardsiella ictaluri]|uniref:Arsenate reductase n=2 Tax=Edwardsiella ictaluri TaxID=67780 RepID=C5BHQ8_EDWI9|nr:arsenate reductase (glutaredoxin) [Edwardsiella ictaluri]ACR68403.1 arsenate reductase, putative [Edwardsiella ictaluri 93-146]ARD40728.1 arsenate reductase (glutaredoxin) [Edwardsiella ictaluri]AVZ81255.1 arsenate reductase (glutaredoxin) [Edwardsiella ictaluri]EKS7763258.1 arsenate reductase (glutaredoxin) [Edwardsiella ictaluri]EKS7770076.1 arsenate reductase (glutaredoxin) [Edwardsiella ictaluri]